MTTKDRTTSANTGWYLKETRSGGLTCQQPPQNVPHFESFSSFQNHALLSDLAVGSDLSGWRQVIAAGGNATNSYSRSASKCAITPFHAQLRIYSDVSCHASGTTEWVGWGCLPGVAVRPPTVDNVAVNRAMRNFVNKANSAISPFQGGTFVGELRETIEMFKKPCVGMRKWTERYLKGLRKTRPGFLKANRQRKQKHIAEQYLEYSFGLRPFINDVKSAGDALSDLLNYNSNQPIHGYGTSDGVSEFTGAETSVSFGSGVLTSQSDSHSYTRAAFFGAVKTDFGRSIGATALEKLGFTPEQFLPTVWELIPYSFLVDYFINVNQIVNAVSFPTSKLAYWGSSINTTRVTETNWKRLTTGVATSDLLGISFDPGKAVMTTTNFVRTVGPSLIPSVSFSIPTNVGQWTNMLGLAVQARAITPY